MAMMIAAMAAACQRGRTRRLRAGRSCRAMHLLYDRTANWPKQMFFTVRCGLLVERKSLYKNELCACQHVLYLLARRNHQDFCRVHTEIDSQAVLCHGEQGCKRRFCR